MYNKYHFKNNNKIFKNKTNGMWYPYKTSTTVYDSPEFSDIKYPSEKFNIIFVDLTKGIDIYNWYVINYNDVIDKYNDFCDFLQNHPLTSDLKFEKITDGKFNTITFPFQKETIPSKEIEKILNLMTQHISFMSSAMTKIRIIVESQDTVQHDTFINAKLMGGLQVKEDEWNNIKNNILEKISETSKKVDEIEKKLKIMDDLFKNYEEIKDVIDIIKNRKLQKTIKKVIDGKNFHKDLDKKNIKNEKKYKMKEYVADINLDLPVIDKFDTSVPNNNIFNSINDEKIIENLNNKIELIDKTIVNINESEILLNEKKLKLSEKFFFKNDDSIEKDLTFVEFKNKPKLSKISKYYEQKNFLNNLKEKVKNDSGFKSIKKDGIELIENHKIILQNEIDNFMNLPSEDYNENPEIKKILKEINKILLFDLDLDGKISKTEYTNKQDFINLLTKITEKKITEFDFYGKIKGIKETKVENNDIPNYIQLKEIKHKIDKKEYTKILNNESSILEKVLKALKPKYESIKKIIDEKQKIKDPSILETQIKFLEKINSDIDFLDFCLLDELNLNMANKDDNFKVWFSKYLTLWKKYIPDIDNKITICKYIQNETSKIKKIKDEIDNDPELKFKKLLDEEIKYIYFEKNKVSNQLSKLNLKLFDTIDDLKKIASLSDLNLDFLTKEEDTKMPPIHERKFYYNMKGGKLLLEKSALLNTRINILFKKIDRYIDIYTETLKINRSLIYEQFYLYILYESLLDKTFDPTIYILPEDIEYSLEGINLYKNPYLKNVKNAILSFNKKLIEISEKQKDKILFIDPKKEKTFIYLLTMKHLSSLINK